MPKPADRATAKTRPRRSAWRGGRWMIGLLLALTALTAAAYGALWLQQERLLFRPARLPADRVLATAPDVHERWVEVPGARLSVLELRLPDPKGVVFFLHGNGGHLASWFINTDFYRQANFDLVMMDYRGYGKSSGRIESEAQLHADVLAVWQQVAQRYAGRPVVVLGRSLGSGLAVTLAQRLQPALTVLVSPYLSMQALTRLHFPWVPVALLRYPLRSDQGINQLRGPVLLVHGEHDRTIPPGHSLALQSLLPSAHRVVVAGAGHGDLQDFETYYQALGEALNTISADPAPSRQ